jgi:hypothetical protein
MRAGSEQILVAWPGGGRGASWPGGGRGAAWLGGGMA